MREDIKAVIFDMDGTIIDSMWVWKKVDEDFLAKRNISATFNIQERIEGLSFVDAARYFKKAFSLEEKIEDIMDEWTEMVKHYYSDIIPLKKGAFVFIESLKSSGIKIGLATSNSRELTESVLKRTGILSFFDIVVTGSEVDREKCFPDIFLKTAEGLNVSPLDCLVFEDTLAGVTGAKKAGMTVTAVYDEYSLSLKEELMRMADRYINNFEEIA